MVGRFLCFIAILALFVTVASTHPSKPNPDSARVEWSVGKPLFLYDIYSFNSAVAGHSQARIYLSFVNDLLQFVQLPNGTYRARYEVAIEILDGSSNRQAGRIANSEIIEHDYDRTNSRSKTNRREFFFDLQPDLYEVLVELTDLDTKRKLKRRRTFELRDFETPDGAISDVVFMEAPKTAGGQQDWFPNLNRTFDDPNLDYRAHFEIYPSLEEAPVVTTEIQYGRDRTVYEGRAQFNVQDQPPVAWIPISRFLQGAGIYTINVEVQAPARHGHREEAFLCQFSPATRPEGGEVAASAVAAMKYIASSEEVSKLKAASPQEQKRLIEEFWQDRDPTPSTAENELRSEFQRRVHFSLQYFSVPAKNQLGWATDRGRIYITYGEPSELRRRGVDLDANPYEIWYYDHMDRRFVFMDKTESGDYKLVHQD